MARVLATFSLVSADVHAEDSLTATLQQRLDGVVAKYSKWPSEVPNLTMSFAWKDGEREVAVASGSAFVDGRVTTIEDTFLFGSGTKPFTAAAVMRMIDQGLVQAEDKAHVYIDPYLASHGKPPLATIFGEEVHKSTVLGLLNMSAGIRDFEADYTLDTWILGNGSRWWDYPYEVMNWSVSEQNIKKDGGSGPLLCEPGKCIAYSSTSYELAGLLLVSVLQPEQPWYEFDLGSAIFGDRSRVPSMVFPPLGNVSARLSEYLTIPGFSESPNWGKAIIHHQDPSVLGWTCGNVVAAPTDVARFFYALLHSGAPDQLVSDASRTMMSTLRQTNAGWLKGALKYGAGLMEVAAGSRTHSVSGIGHDGETYGFKSGNGYFEDLEGAFSLSTNFDSGHGSFAHYSAECTMVEAITQFVTGNGSFSLSCGLFSESDEKVVIVV